LKVASVRLQHFKRFTDLTIREIGAGVRLVVLAGPNGSGKSSLFDAFMLWHRSRFGGWNDDRSYYRKGAAVEVDTSQRIALTFHGREPAGDTIPKCFYFRTAYRNDPEFRLQGLERQGPILEERRFNRMIESDAAVSVNYRRLASQAFEDAFALYPPEMTLQNWRNQRFCFIACFQACGLIRLETIKARRSRSTIRISQGAKRRHSIYFWT
jgi:energy-coupling factor transporter ATP-binding protein EcfA2